MIKLFLTLVVFNLTMMQGAAQLIEIHEPVRFLALGDSYTIGERVDENQRWPVQLINRLNDEYGIQDAEVDIIARTGWTTGNLKTGISQQLDKEKQYNLASLLIGVNNQYQGVTFNRYAPDFRELLEVAIQAVGGDKSKVFVVSIPDYAYTPSFANNERVSTEINAYNAVNESIAKEYGVVYFDITPISRQGLENPDLVADDQLHPSGLQYKAWVDLMIPRMKINTVTSIHPGSTTEPGIKLDLSQGKLSVQLPAAGGRFSLYDELGRIVTANALTGNAHSMNVEQYPPGIYYISYMVGNQSYTRKVFID